MSQLIEAKKYLQRSLQQGPQPVKRLVRRASKRGIGVPALQEATRELALIEVAPSLMGPSRAPGTRFWGLPDRTATLGQDVLRDTDLFKIGGLGEV